MRVHFIGERDDGISVSSHHARALAGTGVTTSFDREDSSRPDPARAADVVHLVTGEQTDSALLRRLAILRLAGIPLVRYWTGRNVLWARFHAASRRFALALTRLGAVQVARTSELVEELSRIAIPAAVGPVVSMHIADTCEPEPLPETFTVLCCLPHERRDYCGGKWVDSLIRLLPHVRFLVVDDRSSDYSACSNVESLGFVDDIVRTIKRSTAVLQARMDGVLSRLSLEALCCGRHVIATHPTPHCQYAASLEAFASSIRALERESDFNLAGREYVCREFGRPQMTDRLLHILHACADPENGAGRRGARVRAVLTALGGCGPGRPAAFARPDPRQLPAEAAAFAALLTPQCAATC
jgi:hypothetical protein